MNRTKHLAGVAVICILALGAVLSGCAQNDATSAANAPAAVAGSGAVSGDLPTGPDGLPVVVITASRTGPKPIVLSERDSSSATD